MVGHVEWVQFGRVEHVPRPGEVVHARECFAEPAGGGGVAAAQLAALAGEALLMTALGEDDEGRRSAARLGELGVRVCAAQRDAPTRGALTLIDAAGQLPGGALARGLPRRRVRAAGSEWPGSA